MDAPLVSRGTVQHPTQAQLALALAVVKLKPTNIGIRDHILQIRQHLGSGRQPQLATTPHRYFDSVAFWQRAYEESEAAQSKLLDRIYDLEQRHEDLVAKPRLASTTGGVLESSKRKTNRNEDGIGTSRKRMRATVKPAKGAPAVSLPGASLDAFDTFEYTEEVTAPFMRHMFTLQQALHKRQSNCVIISAAVNLCKSAEKAIASMFQYSRTIDSQVKTVKMQQNQNITPLLVLGALNRAHELLHRGLDKLTCSAEATTAAGMLKYHLINLFEAVMHALQHRCKAQVGEMVAQPKLAKKRGRPSKSKPLATVSPPKSDSCLNSNDKVSTQIACMLMAMIQVANSSASKRESLLDGYLFVLLNRVGKVLCLFVFRDIELKSDLRVDSTKLSCPGGLVEASLDDASFQAAEAESKCLIWLLERAVALVDVSARLSALKSGTEANEYPSLSMSASLQSVAKIRLRNTILKAVFGEDDPLFSDSLKPLDTPMDLHSLPQPPQKETSEWFTEELWRLLGWDVLARGAEI